MPISFKNKKADSQGYFYGDDVTTDANKFAIVESYKIARTKLMFSLSAKNNKFVAFISWSKGEGKSTATTNMAISLSEMGARVLLIDVDLRKPNIQNLLKLENRVGFSDVLAGFKNVDDVIHKEVLPSLDVITAGAIPPNPSELISSDRLKTTLEKLKESYDYILLDTPPIGLVTDALLLKEYISGYVMIVREKVTTHGDISKALQFMGIMDAQIIGFLKVGCVGKRNKYGYSYKYTYK